MTEHLVLSAIQSLRADPSLQLMTAHELRTEARLALMQAGADADDPELIACVIEAATAAADKGGGIDTVEFSVAKADGAIVDRKVAVRRPMLDDTASELSAPLPEELRGKSPAASAVAGLPEAVIVPPPAPPSYVTLTDPELWRSWKFATALTDAEAAQEMGVSRSTFTAWCAGKRASPLTADEIRKALEILDFRSADLIQAQELARGALREALTKCGK